jgi:hypothetical protein
LNENLIEFNNDTRFVDPNSLSENFVNGKFILKRKIHIPSLFVSIKFQLKVFSTFFLAKATTPTTDTVDIKNTYERQRILLQSPLPNFTLQRKQHSLPYISASNLAHAEAQANLATKSSSNSVIKRDNQSQSNNVRINHYMSMPLYGSLLVQSLAITQFGFWLLELKQNVNFNVFSNNMNTLIIIQAIINIKKII